MLLTPSCCCRHADSAHPYRVTEAEPSIKTFLERRLDYKARSVIYVQVCACACCWVALVLTPACSGVCGAEGQIAGTHSIARGMCLAVCCWCCCCAESVVAHG